MAGVGVKSGAQWHCLWAVCAMVLAAPVPVHAQDRVPDALNRSHHPQAPLPDPETLKVIPLEAASAEASSAALPVPPEISTPTISAPIASTPTVQTSPPSAVWALNLDDERIDLALNRWTREAGYAFRWDADRYFPIAAPTRFSGTYEEAVRGLLSSPGVLNSSYPLEACIYANTPPLVRITRLGDQAQECR